METDTFIADDFLLRNAAGRELFHGVAENLPIIDYHCHIDPSSLMPDRRFADICELWVAADPYKHRAMRINGIPEQEITGSADGKTKFRRWMETLDRCAGNPLHHWAYLELKRFFGRDGIVPPARWEDAWNELNARIAAADFTAGSLVSRVRAELIVTSDLLCDSLSAHRKIAAAGPSYAVAPSLRGDDILSAEPAAFAAFLSRLRAASGAEPSGLPEFLEAVDGRLEFFHQAGCRIADHSLDVLAFEPCGREEAETAFAKLLEGKPLDGAAALRWRSFLLTWLGERYARRGWLLALHLGARRETSSRLRGLAGAAGGYACIGNSVDASALAALLDAMERTGSLPKTLLFTLNPADNAVLATLTGSFAQDGVPGKVQFGPAWWYNDHKMGIVEHLRTLSSHGLLERFIGMTTDSRSVLSLTRHEYFRRVFCDFLGGLAENGELPKSDSLLERMTRAVCYENARNWMNGREMA